MTLHLSYDWCFLLYRLIQSFEVIAEKFVQSTSFSGGAVGRTSTIAFVGKKVRNTFIHMSAFTI